MEDRPRIAILGGGVGSVTAAVQLSKPGWRDHFKSITLYQQGWRLGGKGASGRGPGLRIEEHGLHIWFGFYENAFRMMDLAHRELDRLEQEEGRERWPLAFKRVEESFTPFSEISLTDHDGCCWKLWTADFFDYTDDRPWLEDDPRAPGERPDEWSVAFYAGRCLHLAADLAWSLVLSETGLEITDDPYPAEEQGFSSLDHAADGLWAALGGDIQGVLRAAGHAFDHLTADLLENRAMLDLLELVVRGLEIALDFLRARYDAVVRAHDGVRRAWYVVDLMIAIVRGLIEDGVIAAGSFDVVNGMDFREWLLSHGARRESVDSALVRTVIYDLAFGYRGGDPQRPACEAGTALRGLLRTFFTYRGALMWKMNAGMGDVVFAPLYELLIKRGVEVRFFNRVEEVRARDGAVTEIEIDVQANVPTDTTAESYLQVAADAPYVWPNNPGGILGPGDAAPAAVYESWYAPRDQTRVATKVLRRGDPEDGFEFVVFGFPISCVEKIAPDLPAGSDRWRQAVDALETVPTQAMQLWLTRPACELADVETGIVAGGYVEPFDTWADMQHLVGQERTGAATVAYFCNVIGDSEPPPRGAADAWLAQQQQLVRAHALQFLGRDIGSLWPKTVRSREGGFDWELLLDSSGGVGEARLDAQFLRVNVEPSERYVLSVPGSSAKRIAPDQTGFTNLYAAGDWTDCTLNAGCVEAAAISGIVAANGIYRSLGLDDHQQAIIGRSGP